MEEDIKILEEFIEAYKIAEEVLDGDVIQSIEHLIKRYKQLEEENKELKHITQNYNAYQQKSDNPNSTIIIADEKWFINGYFKENFIPKSKVKEKIEEIEKLKDVPHELDFKPYYRVKDLRNIEIGILQQLLEDFEETGNHIPIID